jgi:hypothetical protein
MDNEDEYPQTDEVKTILNEIAELRHRKEALTRELTDIDLKMDRLQDQLVKEKNRTSSVSGIIILKYSRGSRRMMSRPALRKSRIAFNARRR